MKRRSKIIEFLLRAINLKVPVQEREAEILADKLADELDPQGLHPTEHLHAIEEEERRRHDEMN